MPQPGHPADRSLQRAVGLGLLLGGLLACLLWLPASWLGHAVAQLTGERLLLQDARGTLWNGQARLVLTGGPGSHDAAALPSPVAWRLRPAWAGVTMDITADCCARQAIPVRLQWHWHHTELSLGALDTHWPAEWLAGLGTPWNTIQMNGQLHLVSPGLVVRWQGPQLDWSGQAQLDALGMASRLSTLRPLGSYRISLQAPEGAAAPQLRLDTLSGDLLISGQGLWIGSKWRFTGEASAVPGREAALSNLLNIIGRRNGARSIITVG